MCHACGAVQCSKPQALYLLVAAPQLFAALRRDGSVKIVRLDGSENEYGGTSWFQEVVARPDIVGVLAHYGS